MVASEQEKVLRVLDFVSQKQAYALDRLFSSVNVVSQEEVVSIARESSILEQLE